MTRPTIDITVDAYDAPMLAALAQRLEHIRSLGHGDGAYLSSPRPHGIAITVHGAEVDAAALRRARERQEQLHGAADPLTTLGGEVAEVLKAETDEERVYELLDVAAVCVRIASKIDTRKAGAISAPSVEDLNGEFEEYLASKTGGGAT